MEDVPRARKGRHDFEPGAANKVVECLVSTQGAGLPEQQGPLLGYRCMDGKIKGLSSGSGFWTSESQVVPHHQRLTEITVHQGALHAPLVRLLQARLEVVDASSKAHQDEDRDDQVDRHEPVQEVRHRGGFGCQDTVMRTREGSLVVPTQRERPESLPASYYK